MKIKVKFEPRDLWVGVFWDIEEFSWPHAPSKEYSGGYKILKIYICIIPCFPIIISKKLNI